MKKMKTKRYFAGEDVDSDYMSTDDYKNLESAATREKNEYLAGETAKTEPLKMASFGEAFKDARGRGDKTFEYMGKKYSTETAGGKKSAAPAPAAKSETKPKAGSYGEAARSGRTLGDLMTESANERERLAEAVRSGKEKTLGTKLREGFGRFGRALLTGQPQGGMKKGGKVKKMAKGGSVGSASKRADGCAQRGKTRGKMV